MLRSRRRGRRGAAGGEPGAGVPGDDRRPPRRLGGRHGAAAHRADHGAAAARARGHGDRLCVRAAAGRGRDVSFACAGPSRPFLLGYPWFMLAGSLAVRRRAARGRAGDGSDRARPRRRDLGPLLPSGGPHEPEPLELAVPRQRTRRGPARRGSASACATARTAAARFVCVSEGVAEEMRAHFPRRAERVVTIPNGVDTRRLRARRAAASRRAALRAGLGIPERARWSRSSSAASGRARGSSPRSRRCASRRAGTSSSRAAATASATRELAARAGVAERVHWLGVARDVALSMSSPTRSCCPRATRRSRSSRSRPPRAGCRSSPRR